MAIGGSLSLPRTSAKFDMERPPIDSTSSSTESLIPHSASRNSKPRFSTTTLKYAQMPLPTPPDSAGLEGFKLQLTLMPPTPAHAPDNLNHSLQTKSKRKSQILPYLLTVDDIEDDQEHEPFSPSSTNYSAISEFGPFSRHRDSDFGGDVPPVPPLSPSMSNLSKAGSTKRKSSRLSIQTSATELKEYNPEEEVVPKKPLTNSLVVLTDKRQTLMSETTTFAPLTPVTPKTPISPSLPLAKATRASTLSLAERRAAAKAVKIPTPLTSPTQIKSMDEPMTSPPPLTSRSAAHVEAGRVATPRTATFGKPEVSTPRSATFAVLPPPAAAQSSPRSAAMFSPTGRPGFSYIPHKNVPSIKSPGSQTFSPKSATFSPRSVAFSPIHEDVDREKLKTPTAVNMLVQRAQEYQQGFVSGLMSPVIKGEYETLWNVANAQMLVNDTFTLSTFREDSFTFTGAEHFTFGADPTAAFYRLSAHPSHQQDALFSDLKIHRSNPTTQTEVPVIHLQLEAPVVEASGVIALIYPQVAAMMLDSKARDIKKDPKLDVGEEEECCRLVYEIGKGFALFHPAKDEEGGWLNIVVTGRVGFDVIGADGSISICSSTHPEPLVTLDFGNSELKINAGACATINSLYIVDVAVAAVLTVATVEGRRLRAIQEDLDQILAYELATSPQMSNETPQIRQQNFPPVFDYSFATAVGRNGSESRTYKKKSGISKALDDLIKAILKMLRSLSGKKQKRSKTPQNNNFEEFEFPFQRDSRSEHARSSSYPSRPSQAYVRN